MKLRWICSTLIATAFLALTIPAPQAHACSPPTDLWVQPYTSQANPLPLAQGTDAFHLTIDSYLHDLTPDSLDFELRELQNAQLSEPLPLSFSTHSERAGKIDISVDIDELAPGLYQLMPLPDFDVYDYVETLFFEIVEAELTITVGAPTADIVTYRGGNRYCCDLLEDHCIGLCGIDDDCRSCWYDRELTQHLIEIDFEVVNGQASTEVFVNDELVETLSGLHRNNSVYLPREPETAVSSPGSDERLRGPPYCVRLVFRSMTGDVIDETPLTCLQASDFPDLKPAKPLPAQSQHCKNAPVLVEGTPRASAGCSTTSGTSPSLYLLLLGFFAAGRLRRRRH